MAMVQSENTEITKTPPMRPHSMPRIDPEAPFTRAEAAAALTAAGYPTTYKTLSTKACRGGGPVMRRFGNRVIYLGADLLEWAESNTTAPHRTTSDPARRRAAI